MRLADVRQFMGEHGFDTELVVRIEFGMHSFTIWSYERGPEGGILGGEPDRHGNRAPIVNRETVNYEAS